MQEIFNKQLNFRDLGGYVTKDGRMIKPGIFYRSGGIFLFNEQELERLKALKIHTIFDLRTKEEIEERPNPVIPGVNYIQFSGVMNELGEEIDFSPTGMRQIGGDGFEQLRKLQDYYCEIPFHNKAMKLFFEQIKEGNVPILFHCASGKDRTGVTAILLLLLLGVDDQTIMEDYMLSNKYLEDNIERELMENKEIIEKHPEAKELLTMMMGVSANIGETVIKTIYERSKTVEQYFLEEYGFDEEMIHNIRNKYLY